MKTIIKVTLFSLSVLASNFATAAQNVVLVTLDGVRWQEVFYGADNSLINNTDFVKKPEQLNTQFWAKTANER